MQVFWSVTLHYWVSNSRHFRGTWCPHLQCKDFGILDPEDEGTIVWNIRTIHAKTTASRPKASES